MATQVIELKNLRSSENLLALTRIGFGLAFLIHYLSIFPWLNEFFSFSRGVGALAYLDSETTLYGLYAIIIVSSLFFILGLFSRVSLIALMATHFLFIKANPDIYAGWAFVSFHFVWLFLLIDTGRALSLDTVIFKKKKRKDDFYYLLLLLILTQLALIYFVPNVVRLFSRTWQQGETLFGVLGDPVYSRISFINWRNHHAFVFISHYIVWITEILGISIFLFRCRRWLAYSLLFLHLFLLFFAKVGTWPILMIGLSFLLFIDAEESKAFLFRRKNQVIALIYFFILGAHVVGPDIYQKVTGDKDSSIQNSRAMKLFIPLRYLMLDYGYYTRVFPSHHGRYESCYLVMGMNKNIPDVIHASEIPKCTGSIMNLYQDPIEDFFEINSAPWVSYGVNFKKLCNLWPGYESIHVLAFSRYKLFNVSSAKIEGLPIVTCADTQTAISNREILNSLKERNVLAPQWKSYITSYDEDTNTNFRN